MIVEFLPEAEAELAEGIDYFDSQLPGLGDRFDREVWSALDSIRSMPHAWTPMGKRARKCNLRSFLYGIIYQTRGDMILVVAVMNLRRRPGYWRKRLR